MRKLLELIVSLFSGLVGRSEDFAALSQAWQQFSEEVRGELTDHRERLKTCEEERRALEGRVAKLEASTAC